MYGDGLAVRDAQVGRAEDRSWSLRPELVVVADLVEPDQRARWQQVAGVAGQREEPVGGHHGVLLAAAALAADPPVADRDRAGQHAGDVGIVGDQDDGRAVGPVDQRECRQDLVAGGVVELAGGLVAEEQARTGGDRDGDRGQLESTGGQRSAAGQRAGRARPPRGPREAL